MEQATKEEESGDTHGGESVEKKALQSNMVFKKRNAKGSHVDKKNEGIPELLRGVIFCIPRDSPDMYLKAVKRLDLFLCTNYKNGTDIQMWLDAEELILTEEPIMLDNLIPKQEIMCYLSATEVIKNREILKRNLRSLYTVVLSLCDMIMEDKVTCHEEYATIKRNRNTIKLLQVIKQLMYSNSSEEIHTVHNSTCLECDKKEGNCPSTSKNSLQQ